MKAKFCLALAMGLLMVSALEAQTVHFAFTNNGDGTATVTQAYYTSYFTHPGGPFTIPSTYNGLPVTSIAGSFSDTWGLYFTSITIPASVTNIGDYAFEDDNSLTSIYFEGNAPGVGLFSFETHSQGNTTAYYLANTMGWFEYDTNANGGIFAEFAEDGVHWQTWTPNAGSVEVTIKPPAAISAGAQWGLDGTPTNGNGTTLPGVLVGNHVLSFLPIPGWYPAADQSVVIKNGVTTKATVTYVALPPKTALLALQINGNGTVTPNDNGKPLLLGNVYKLTAKAASGWVFSNWVASGGENFVSTAAVLPLTMHSNLVLQANFAPTPFAGVQGTYIGLFTPNGPGASTVNNTGFFSLTVTVQGTFTGYLQTAGNRKSITGQLDDNLDYTNNISLAGEGTVTLGLNLDAGAQLVTGSLNGGTMQASIMAEEIVSGKVVFTETGRYVIALSDGTDASTGTAVLNFTKSGPTTLTGKLPNGTPFSASSVFCPYYNADWPFFASLNGGKSCLVGRMFLSDGDPSGYFTLVEPSGANLQIDASDVSAP